MKSSLKIGRDNTNDVIINEPRVSRNHAIITVLENGGYEVKDLGSTNGTYINGLRINKQIINPGDKLQVASSIVSWEKAFQTSSSAGNESILTEEPFTKIRKTITIGSAHDNDIVLEGDYVSTHHANISLLKDGNYYLQDMDSLNGSHVNGSKVNAKNFSQTDVVKIAGSDLPNNWFEHKNLKHGFYKDNKKVILITISSLLLITVSGLIYFNGCKWFGWGCQLSAEQIYSRYRNSIVHIKHEYFYTISVDGTKYYVGKNKNFPMQTEANPEKTNLLAYSKISGNGCFINPDGSILTSPLITNPWLNETEQRKMLKEVIESKTIKGLKENSFVSICGETAELRFIQNGVINNDDNFIEAKTSYDCLFTDSTTAIIQSVKTTLPGNTSSVKIHFNEKSKQPLHHISERYFGHFVLPRLNEMIKDTFYVINDTTNINDHKKITITDSIPAMKEGSPVLNARGELAGMIQQNQFYLLHHYIKQINKP